MLLALRNKPLLVLFVVALIVAIAFAVFLADGALHPSMHTLLANGGIIWGD